MSYYTIPRRLGLRLGAAARAKNVKPVISLNAPSPQAQTHSAIGFGQWTTYIKFADTGAPASTQKLWNIQLNASNLAFLHYLSNSNLQLTVISAGVTKTYIFAGSSYLRGKGDATIVVAARQNDIVVAINGVIMLKVSEVAMPTGTPVGLGVGQNYAGTQPLGAAIREFAYYNKRLSDTQVKALGRHKDFGVTATYDPDRLVHFKLGQSNSVGTQATAPDPTIYANIARMQIIEKSAARKTAQPHMVAGRKRCLRHQYPAGAIPQCAGRSVAHYE
jgi:hypothetical protein